MNVTVLCLFIMWNVFSFDVDAVHVSCLQYIPQIGSLFVGFSFGCYQIWKLHAPVLEYVTDAYSFNITSSYTVSFFFIQIESSIFSVYFMFRVKEVCVR